MNIKEIIENNECIILSYSTIAIAITIVVATKLITEKKQKKHSCSCLNSRSNVKYF